LSVSCQSAGAGRPVITRSAVSVADWPVVCLRHRASPRRRPKHLTCAPCDGSAPPPSSSTTTSKAQSTTTATKASTTSPTATSSTAPSSTCPVAGASCPLNGVYACTGSSFGICDNGAWVIQSCGSGDVCVQNGSGIYCDVAGSSTPVCV
jgi:hypothetical protein